jgi:nitrate reductase cytochrome c-type subunit
VTAARVTEPARVLRRVGLIVISVVTMGALVFAILPKSKGQADFRTVAMVVAPDAERPIAAEVGAFRDLREGLHVVSGGDASPHVVVPTRMERRERRAYDGAPPSVPHPLAAGLERTQDCAPCHTFGGYNPGIRTYTPRTPHPELTNCLQCHVPRVVSDLLVPTDWRPPPWPEISPEGGLVGAPPRIPHLLQMRERCLACHGGASAAPDIRTTHPERFNCRQCHLPVEEFEGVFSRGEGPGGAS